jgi:enoyl-CoA hydratase/carnithine racemase
MPPTQHVEFSLRAKVGEIRLNRPDELNALSLEMIAAIDHQLAAWSDDPGVSGIVIRGKGGEAFCAGIDQRALYLAHRDGDRTFGPRFFRSFYDMLYRISLCPKPIVAVMNGVTMGGGVALAMNCGIRVAARETYCALADCKIGFFPDGGAAAFLQRCPGEIGMFLALTGVALRGRGMVHAGLATHLVPEDRISLVTPALVDQLAIAPPISPLAEMEPRINQIFGLAGIGEIMAILAVRSGEWAKMTLQQMREQSPTSLAVTFRHLRASKGKPLDAVLATDYRLSQHLLDGHDFQEGIRAFVIDRDKQPKWQPAEPALVSKEAIDGLFGPVAGLGEWTPVG